MYRSILIIFLLMLTFVSAKSQKWQPGYIVDSRGQKIEGLINPNPSGKGPIKEEGFIVYKADKKATETRFSASDIKAFVIGQDSFVVAHAPNNETWSKHELDFIKVVLDEPTLKLYVLDGSSGGGGKKFGFHPSIGIGTGGYGGFGGGVSIGGGGNQGYGGNAKTTYFYGANTAEMQQVTPQNFQDIMMEIMGDEPQAVEVIRSKKAGYGNIENLIKYFRELKAAHGRR